MDYAFIKNMHMGLAYLSVSLFIFRSILSVTGSGLLQHKVLKILPHVIDTFLLLFAVHLMVVIKQYPFVDDWLTAKLLGLIAYILVGTVAIKRGKTAVIRFWASVGAVTIFAYIFGVAKSHSVLSWFAFLS